MTDEERRIQLLAHNQEKMYWYVILGLELIGLINTLYGVIKYFIKTGVPSAGFFGLASIVLLLIGIGLNVWIAWGIWRLERWVTLWMWIAVIGSALTFNIFSFLLSLAVLLGYKKILKVVYPTVSAIPKTPTV